MDVGAFELTEARLLIEGEVAALAATQIRLVSATVTTGCPDTTASPGSTQRLVTSPATGVNTFVSVSLNS